jgi:hypothetical protein
MGFIFLLALIVGLPAAVAAQEPPREPDPRPAPVLDATALGVSIERIERKLAADAQAPTVSPFGGDLKLDFFVGVVGTAPPIDFFANFNVHSGPVPGTAPTHRDVVDFLTPEAFKSPAPDLLGLAWWIGDHLYRRVQQQRWEREMERYRQMVEAGFDVPAPRPPGQK